MRPFEIVYGGVTRPSMIVEWIDARDLQLLNVAGNRESVCPGIGERVERFMGELLRRIGHVPTEQPRPAGRRRATVCSAEAVS